MLDQYSDDLTKIELYPNGKLFRITYDSGTGMMRIMSRRYDAFEDIRDKFSASNDAAFFSRVHGFKAEAKVYAINKFGCFDSGLLFDILEQIKTEYGDCSCVAMSANCLKYIQDYLRPLKAVAQKNQLDMSTKISNIAEDIGKNNELKRLGKTPFEFRDYQEESVRQLLFKGFGRGLIEIPTAGGKSFILANFIWNMLKLFSSKLKSLILVPNKQLVEQFYKDLIDYGYDPHSVTRFTAGLRGKDAFDSDAKITIANRQYVFKNQSKLPVYDILICDEVHQAAASATREFVNSLHCKVKVGCTGTLPKGKFQKWQLIGMFGKVLYKEDITALQDKGYISQLKITLLNVFDKNVESDRNLLFHCESLKKYKPDENGISDVQFNDAYNAELEYFTKWYIDLYTPVLQYVKSLSENILILFDRLEIGKNIFSLAQEMLADQKVWYIDGTTPIDQRENIRAQLESSGDNVLFAQTTVFSTGINIKRLTHIMFLFNTKSFSRVLQSIGRTLRLHATKKSAHLIDVSFNTKYSQKHLSERLKIYKESYNKKPDEKISLQAANT